MDIGNSISFQIKQSIIREFFHKSYIDGGLTVWHIVDDEIFDFVSDATWDKVDLIGNFRL